VHSVITATLMALPMLAMAELRRPSRNNPPLVLLLHYIPGLIPGPTPGGSDAIPTPGSQGPFKTLGNNPRSHAPDAAARWRQRPQFTMSADLVSFIRYVYMGGYMPTSSWLGDVATSTYSHLEAQGKQTFVFVKRGLFNVVKS
jgi:hypothetical protein